MEPFCEVAFLRRMYMWCALEFPPSDYDLFGEFDRLTHMVRPIVAYKSLLSFRELGGWILKETSDA